MKQIIYFVDAFAEKVFEGNQAGVLILDEPLDETLMQKIAAENNLSETAFVVKNKDAFSLRWFTPSVEVDLCGHATLASAFVLFNELNYEKQIIEFHSKSGVLTVKKNSDKLTMNFPAGKLKQIDIPQNIKTVFGVTPIEAYRTTDDLMFVFDDETSIVKMSPNLTELNKYDCRGVIITAKSKKYDFVSRFFAPQSGINEDPVTGSAHTALTVYWSEILKEKFLTAKQVSKRGGILYCENLGERIEISGSAVLYLKGEINI